MSFQPFDCHQPVEVTRRNLPHRQQNGATYFVTFRLVDSLPMEARIRLGELRQLNDADGFAWMESYLDAGNGSSILSQSIHASLLETTLRHFDEIHYALGAFAIMPNHVHALVQPFVGESLTRLVHSWKSYTANRLQRSAGIKGHVWQEETFDRIVRDASELCRFHDYILANPARAHLRTGSFICGEGSAGNFGIA
jgi:REP element-mobilizing transposase RayT